MPWRGSGESADRTARVAALQAGIESADELLVPTVDLDGETPEVVSRRARIQARSADERARRAFAMATEVEKHMWTRDQHRRFADQLLKSWGRMQRRFYILLITITLSLFAALALFWQLFSAQQVRDIQVNEDLQQLIETMVLSCETRNEQLRQSRSIYGQLASAFDQDPATAPQAQALRDAEASLPDPVDCSRYERATSP